MARTWNGSAGFDEIIVLSPGGCAGIDGGPITVAWIWKPSTATAGGLIQGRNGVNPVWSLLREPNAKYFVDGDFTGFDASAADGQWQLVAYTKASGSAAVRWHLYRYDTHAWTHTDGVTVGDGTGPVDAIWLGKAYNRLDGDGALAAVWADVLTDAQVELLPFTLQAWYGLAPAGGWLLDQADTAQNVIDFTGGGAHQSAITGTAPTVAAASVPVFSYGHPVLIPHIAAAGPGSVDLTAAVFTSSTAAAGSSSTTAAARFSSTTAGGDA